MAHSRSMSTGDREPTAVPPAPSSEGSPLHAESSEGTQTSLLVITGDEKIAKLIEAPLGTAGYAVTRAASGRAGLELLASHLPDVVLLDLTLPDMEGISLCRSLRQAPETRRIPIMIVTARASETDRIVAFELGVDDFISEPISVRELLLRVRVQVRGRSEALRTTRTLEVGRIRLDAESHRVWVGDAEVALSVREFRMLEVLMSRVERVLSRQSLLDVVWGPTANVGVRAVDAYVTRLRKKLGEARDYVETVSSVGYRLRRPAE